VPIDREKTLQAAQKYIEKKKYDRAIAEYQRIVQEDPNDARTLLKIGDLQARLQAYPEAIATYDRVGQYYSAQGFALKAIAVYKQIRELIKKHAPDLADRYGHIVPKLAEIYTQLGLTSDALAAYDEVATRLQRAGRDREAIDVFRKMVELDENNPLPHLRLAEACCRVQSLDEAIESFWTAAELLLNLGRSDDALKVIERILHFRADARFARVAAELYLGRGTREDGMLALSKLQVCFQANPKDLDTLSLLAQTFTLIGAESKALEVYKEMARLAREQNRDDLYRELLQHLRQMAPEDDTVRTFESLLPALQSERPRETSHVNVDDAEIEMLDAPPSFEAMPLITAKGLPVARSPMSSAPDVVVVDEQQQAAEELLEPGSFDPRAHARKALVDADSFRKLRLYPKAIEALHIALEIDPRSLEIRQKLRELLIESGDRQGAIQETVNIAQLHIERGDVQHAEPLLYEVLELDPEHPDAIALLGELVPADAQYTEDLDDGRTRVQAPILPEADGFDPEAPLPSYDLEEISAEQAMSSEPGRSFTKKSATALTIDDPFGIEARNLPAMDQPLPSFPLGSEPDDLGVGDEVLAASASLSEYEDVEEISSVEDFDAPTSLTKHAEDAAEGLEDVLDEAEFFAARGLFEDARAILVEQLGRTPNHPLVTERLREIEAQLLSSTESQTIERSQLGAPIPAVDLDIAASLGALDELEPPPSMAASSANFGPASADLDVDQVFAKFKAGIRAQVSENDSSTHYDLGVAYKEMALLSDAIHEFELAARDAQRECMCYAMIGMIHLEQDQLDRAADAYIRALSAPSKTVDQEMSLYYDLGNVYEMKEKYQDALYYFQKIARRDPGYRDVADRIAQLQPGGEGAPAPGARAVNHGDDFDRVFDDLFERKG
jgi:tetratricopeptide (TPR) repeat protein